MAVGFGATPTLNANNEVISGTTDADVRKVWAGLYPQPGLLSGGKVKTSASTQTYTVTAGAAVIRMSEGEHVPAPIPAGTLTVAPTGAARVDVIYAQQNIPSVEGNSNVEIKVGRTLPTVRAVELARYTQPATATNTNSGVLSGEVNYVIPYGANLGTLWSMQDTLYGPFTTRTTIGTGSFYIPTDRQLRANMTTVVVSDRASGFDNTKYCESSYILTIDGKTVAYWRSPGLHQAWQWIQFESEFTCLAGTHTISISRGREIGPGTPLQVYGDGNSPGCKVELRDAGVVR